MKRPLALFGCTWLLVLLAAARWPAGVVIPLAALPGAAFLLALLLHRRKKSAKKPAVAALLCAAAALALLFRAGYDVVVLRPLTALHGDEYTATAHVTAVEPGNSEDTWHTTLRITALDGEELRAFTVRVPDLPQLAVGQDVRLPLRFAAQRSGNTALRAYAKGVYIDARAAGEVQPLGESTGFWDALRRVQYAASANIRAALPDPYAGTTAAMAVGDRRFVATDTTDAFRAAGLSHLLVVSGLHLTLVCGGVYKLLLRATRRQKLASVGGMLCVLGFMAFTGLAHSVVRAGVMMLVLLAAPLFTRRSDSLTSLGFAALILCLQNPYAAADVGLLLSFAATLGALVAGPLQHKLKQRWPASRWPMRALRGAVAAAVLPAAVVVCTLPVLLRYSLGFSLLSIPANLVAVPLLPAVVLTGFVMAIPAGLPLLGLLVRPAAFVNGVLQVWLARITDFCHAQRGWAYLHVGGGFALVVLLACYLLVWRAVKTRRALLPIGTAVLCVALALALHTGLSRGTVRLVLAGNTSPSLVLVHKGQAVVLYRGAATDTAVERALDENGVDEVVLVVDLRQNPQGTQYERWAPGAVLVAAHTTSHTALQPMQGIEVGIRRQGGGTLVCVQVGDVRIGLVSGSFDMTGYEPLHYAVGSAGTLEGFAGTLVATGSPPEWPAEQLQLLESGGSLWLRPGGGVRYREVRDGGLEG